MSIYKLTQDELVENQQNFIKLVKDIDREGFSCPTLINYLTNQTDFFTAPASKTNHRAYYGGLCEHSLDVYNNMKKLIDTFGLVIPESSIIITALFHDISLVNTYVPYASNKKVYSNNGRQRDNLGTYDWVSELAFTKNDSTPLIYGSHEMNSEYIIRRYIPLAIEESVAITHHHAGLSWDSAKDDIATIYSNYPLAMILHEADMMSTFIAKNE